MSGVILTMTSAIDEDSVVCYLRLRLDAVGIKEIRRCEINTTDCQTNWYEIVWKEGARK